MASSSLKHTSPSRATNGNYCRQRRCGGSTATTAILLVLCLSFNGVVGAPPKPPSAKYNDSPSNYQGVDSSGLDRKKDTSTESADYIDYFLDLFEYTTDSAADAVYQPIFGVTAPTYSSPSSTIGSIISDDYEEVIAKVRVKNSCNETVIVAFEGASRVRELPAGKAWAITICDFDCNIDRNSESDLQENPVQCRDVGWNITFQAPSCERQWFELGNTTVCSNKSGLSILNITCDNECRAVPVPIPSPPPPAPTSQKFSKAAIIGGAVGGAAVLTVLTVSALALYERRKCRRTSVVGLDCNKASEDPEAQDGKQSGESSEYSNALTNSKPNTSSPTSSKDLQLRNSSSSDVPSKGDSGTISKSSIKSDQSLTPAWSSGAMIKCIDVTKEVQLGACIGEGSYGKVCRGTWNRTEVAVKFLTSKNIGLINSAYTTDGGITLEELAKELERESLLMAQLRFPNVVQLIGVCTEPPCIITEFCSRGSLLALLREAKASPAKAAELTWPRRLNLLADAARGVLYLHSNEPQVLHRDLKSPNILVNEFWVGKVADFGMSRLQEEYSSKGGGLAGNPRWLSPECLEGEPFTQAGDAYSFGIVLCEALTWKLPWAGCNDWAIVNAVREGRRPQIPETLPGDAAPAKMMEGYLELMTRCWAQEAAVRPSFDVIVDELERLKGYFS